MKKVKIEKSKNTHKLILFGIKRIKITPYIDTELQMVLFNLCEKTLCENRMMFDIHKMPLFKTIFDMVVVSQCSNVEVQGVKKTNNENGGYMIDLDINQEIIKDFENSKLAKKIIKKIDNHKSVWGMIESFVRDSVVITAFSVLGNGLPSTDEFTKNMDDMIKVLDNISKKEPKIIEETLTKPMAMKVKNDMAKQKAETKRAKKGK